MLCALDFSAAAPTAESALNTLLRYLPQAAETVSGPEYEEGVGKALAFNIKPLAGGASRPPQVYAALCCCPLCCAAGGAACGACAACTSHIHMDPCCALLIV